MIDRRSHEFLNIAGGAIAIVLCSLLGFALYALVKFDVRPTNHDILLVVITFLTTKISTIVDFFYGSSSTGRQQQATIATLANQTQSDKGGVDVTVTTERAETAGSSS